MSLFAIRAQRSFCERDLSRKLYGEYVGKDTSCLSSRSCWGVAGQW